ncbi:siderophore-interacting protein [Polymorphospora sp. NPDC050346]|uniref:siderophore-interacting protein n=1 Tax=Polymorphospora sp. NPDC050346 TaxID=3155780 RepID=UPI0034114A5D
MGVNWQRGVLRLLNVANHPVEVVAVRDITPWYRRITFAAPELLEVVEPFPTLWLRLWIPNRNGTLVQRGYTFVGIDRSDATFTLDFVLHDVSGPAGDWARAATVGATAEVALTPAKISAPDGTRTMILAGDATALPAINTWLEHLPADVRAEVYLADSHPDRADLPVVDRANTELTWVDATLDGAPLAAAVAATGTGPAGVYAWAAGEKNLVKALRPVFAERLGLDRRQRFTQFYWIRGRAAG